MGQTTAQARPKVDNLKHARYVCNHGKHETKKWACVATYWLIYANHLERFRQTMSRPPHYDQWLCIHGYEGSWTDPGDPYYGGLQMDIGFQTTYGRDLYNRKGTADHWTPMEQMWVAERAYKTRGFWPWPNTARYCGLL